MNAFVKTFAVSKMWGVPFINRGAQMTSREHCNSRCTASILENAKRFLVSSIVVP